MPLISDVFDCIQGYVTEGIPATQRYLQTSRKLQIELSSVYRHMILLSGATALASVTILALFEILNAYTNSEETQQFCLDSIDMRVILESFRSLW